MVASPPTPPPAGLEPKESAVPAFIHLPARHVLVLMPVTFSSTGTDLAPCMCFQLRGCSSSCVLRCAMVSNHARALFGVLVGSGHWHHHPPWLTLSTTILNIPVSIQHLPCAPARPCNALARKHSTIITVNQCIRPSSMRVLAMSQLLLGTRVSNAFLPSLAVDVSF